MSVNIAILQYSILMLAVITILLGLHDMDNGQNLRYLEAKGYPVHETNLNGDMQSGRETYRNGALRALTGISILWTIPVAGIWRKE